MALAFAAPATPAGRPDRDPEVLINLAIGGSDNVNPTASTFPAVYSIDSFKVYVK